MTPPTVDITAAAEALGLERVPRVEFRKWADYEFAAYTDQNRITGWLGIRPDSFYRLRKSMHRQHRPAPRSNADLLRFTLAHELLHFKQHAESGLSYEAWIWAYHAAWPYEPGYAAAIGQYNHADNPYEADADRRALDVMHLIDVDLTPTEAP